MSMKRRNRLELYFKAFFWKMLKMIMLPVVLVLPVWGALNKQ